MNTSKADDSKTLVVALALAEDGAMNCEHFGAADSALKYAPLTRYPFHVDSE